jgi:hypothetical protein
MHNEFEAECQNRGSINPSCICNILPDHKELLARITHLCVRERIIAGEFEQLEVYLLALQTDPAADLMKKWCSK